METRMFIISIVPLIVDIPVCRVGLEQFRELGKTPIGQREILKNCYSFIQIRHPP